MNGMVWNCSRTLSRWRPGKASNKRDAAPTAGCKRRSLWQKKRLSHTDSRARMSHLIEWLTASQGYFQNLGWWGVLAFGAVIMVVQLVLVPVAPLGIASGMMFGLGKGMLAVTLGTALGMTLNFLLARHVARAALAHRLQRSEKFRLIDVAIGREGWRIVALLRFVPMPFGIANFCYGLTAIPFWPYLFASMAAIIPSNFFFVWFGASAHESLQSLVGGGRPRQPFEYVMLVVGLAATFAALTYISRIARAAVANHGTGTETVVAPAE